LLLLSGKINTVAERQGSILKYHTYILNAVLMKIILFLFVPA